MMTNTPDPIAAAAALFALFVGPAAAAVAGPYLVIFLAALLAAGVALGRAEPMRAWQGLWFVGSAVLAAMLLTVSAAQLLARGVDWGLHLQFDQAALLVPCALLIAGSRGYWWAAVLWAAGLVRKRAERN